ncbi:hypothetical protein [Sphingobacterium sp. HMSC13C05]|nr:hypothetical protein [Sphingobacterium sp. HMSC13C05]
MKTKKKPLKTITPKAVFNFKGTSAKSASGEPTTTLIIILPKYWTTV